MIIVAVYFIILNTISMTLMYMDKYYARTSRYRISESVLLWTSFLGGSLGGFLGMKLFKHKTRRPKFKLGLPLMILLHIFIFLFFLFKSKYGL